MGMLLRRHRREEPVKEKEEVVEAKGDVFPRPTGGGWYELSNGEKVQGKGDAELREVELLTGEVEDEVEEENLEEGD